MLVSIMKKKRRRSLERSLRRLESNRRIQSRCKNYNIIIEDGNQRASLKLQCNEIKLNKNKKKIEKKKRKVREIDIGKEREREQTNQATNKQQ
jgi:hypothetical protein